MEKEEEAAGRKKSYKSKIKRVNTAIKNGGKNRTLTDMIKDYNKDNNIRDTVCDFELLKKKINEMKDKKGNSIESYF